jgi:hypothetical protein
VQFADLPSGDKMQGSGGLTGAPPSVGTGVPITLEK